MQRVVFNFHARLTPLMSENEMENEKTSFLLSSFYLLSAHQRTRVIRKKQRVKNIIGDHNPFLINLHKVVSKLGVIH